MDSIQQVGAVGPVSKPKIICIEGNAGSGKSALIESVLWIRNDFFSDPDPDPTFQIISDPA
jgi:excinuclease UvrABC ATPase subunit